jgi:hypothetical protein
MLFGAGATFITYGVINFVAAVYVYFCVPDLKSLS